MGWRSSPGVLRWHTTVPDALGVRMPAGDQPGPALEGDVGPEPLRCHDQPIAKADQEVDVGDAPYPPGKPPLYPPVSLRSNSRATAPRSATRPAWRCFCRPTTPDWTLLWSREVSSKPRFTVNPARRGKMLARMRSWKPPGQAHTGTWRPTGGSIGMTSARPELLSVEMVQC